MALTVGMSPWPRQAERSSVVAASAWGSRGRSWDTLAASSEALRESPPACVEVQGSVSRVWGEQCCPKCWMIRIICIPLAC